MICCRPCCAIISTSESVALFAPLSCKRQRGFFVGGCVPGRCSYPAGRRGAFHANKHGLRHPVSASLTLASCWPLPQQLLPVFCRGQRSSLLQDSSPALPPAAAGSRPQDIRWRNFLPSCRRAAVNIKRSSPKGGGLFVFTKEIRYGIIIEEKICCVEEL